MAFKDLFKDSNDINEKSVVGFASFVIMVLFALADLLTGYLGKDLVINECGTRPPIVTQWIQSKIKQLEEKNAVPKKTSA